jgi:dihydrofolate reductase
VSKLIYLMNVSVDGFVETPDHSLEWADVDDELHTWFNEHEERAAAFLYGRRLYEVMAYWETAGSDPNLPAVMRDYARIWNATPKIVFSSSLESVAPGSRLVRGDPLTEFAAIRHEFPGDIGVGGPTLAAAFARAGLVDEYQMVVHPVVLGAGTPFWPAGVSLDLELVETRRFGGGRVLLAYRAKRRDQ